MKKADFIAVYNPNNKKIYKIGTHIKNNGFNGFITSFYKYRGTYRFNVDYGFCNVSNYINILFETHVISFRLTTKFKTSREVARESIILFLSEKNLTSFFELKLVKKNFLSNVTFISIFFLALIDGNSLLTKKLNLQNFESNALNIS